ncbi:MULTISPECIES: hypothetical protein [Chryseobacterium]|uniref:hypothetical protein n=1 Tax=Chryseobacterium sp. R2A-55 TaxID=2744445 RepID=UPI001F48B2D3|nr:hypothetical protein [Chryseobacterium sp. R2A-55]
MRKLFSILLFLSSIVLSAQITETSVEKILEERRLKVDSLATEVDKLQIIDTQLNFLTEALEAISPIVKDVLSLDNFSNPAIQKTLIKPLAEKYYSAFNYESEGKKGNSLKYGFVNKEDFSAHYKIVEALLLSKIVMQQYSVLLDYHKKSLQRTEDYINRNLKALGISRADYDNLSENDAIILQKQFK